jgi:putative membrane protein
MDRGTISIGVRRIAKPCAKNPGTLVRRLASNPGKRRAACISSFKGLAMISLLKISALAIAVLSLSTAVKVRAADTLTDPQIAHIAYTAGVLDIKAAEQALEKSKDKNVRAFANDMVRDHKAVNEKALALVKKLNVTPQDNDTSKSLVAAADTKRAEFAKLSGAAFDKAYAENEVAYHKTVNGALSGTLIPAVSNAELKNLLEQGLKIFQGHEQHAEHVVSELK